MADIVLPVSAFTDIKTLAESLQSLIPTVRTDVTLAATTDRYLMDCTPDYTVVNSGRNLTLAEILAWPENCTEAGSYTAPAGGGGA